MKKYKAGSNLFLALCMIILLPVKLCAQNKIIVIPMGSDGSPLKNVVTVSQKNGDFKDPIVAMASITDASESNPYLLYIGPGVYPLTVNLLMKEFVDITGSGENITTLTLATTSTVYGADNSRLKDLAIEKSGMGFSSYAIDNDGQSPVIENVTVNFSDGTAINRAGIYNRNSSTAYLKNVTVIITNGSTCRGVVGSSSNFSIDKFKVSIDGCSNSSIGLSASLSEIKVNNANIATTGVNSFAVYSNDSIFSIRQSWLSGEVRSLNNLSSNSTVSHSTIINPGSAASCIYVDDGIGNALSDTCSYVP